MTFERNHKTKVYVESKFTNNSFFIIKINNEPLNLIYLNIDNLKFVQTRDEKNNIFFIDDFIIYCYTYLLISKYIALEMFKKYKNEVEN